jgi:hypothetical protein
MSELLLCRGKANGLINVRFDRAAEHKLVLVWSDPVAPETTDYARAANLLFSVIGAGSRPADLPVVTAPPPEPPLRQPTRVLPRRNLFQSFLADPGRRQSTQSSPESR